MSLIPLFEDDVDWDLTTEEKHESSEEEISTETLARKSRKQSLTSDDTDGNLKNLCSEIFIWLCNTLCLFQSANE